MSDEMNEELKGLFERMANEVPATATPPPKVLRRARRRMVATVTAGVFLLGAAGSGAYAAVRAVSGRTTVVRPAATVPSTTVEGDIVFVSMDRTWSRLQPGYGSPGVIPMDQGWDLPFGLHGVTPDGQGGFALTAPFDRGYATDMAWSPDGSKVAFAQIPDGASSWNRELFVVNADGSGLRQLTANDADDTSPAWSPDGSRVAFVSDRDDPHAHDTGHAAIYELYVMDADGSRQTRLTDCTPDCGGNGEGDPAWSPDGSKIAFSGSRAIGADPDHFRTDIYVVNADGTALRKLVEAASEPARFGRSVAPAWAPDGSHIAFSTCCGGPEGIVLADADGANAHLILEDPSVFDLTWSLDSTRIAFASYRDAGTEGLQEGDPGNSEIYVLDVATGDVTRITDDSGWDGNPAWLP